MKVATWNCMGVGNHDMIKHAKLMMLSNNMDAVCFLETKTNKAARLLNMAYKMGYC